MSVNAVSGTSATNPYDQLSSNSDSLVSKAKTKDGSTPSTSATGSNNIDQSTFLKLLVAQLKYQDPMNPSDPTQYLSETAQFTVVERLNALSDLQTQAVAAGRQQLAASMVGQNVTWKDASGTSVTGMCTGVSVGASTPNLTVGGKSVSLDQVTSVAKA